MVGRNLLTSIKGIDCQLTESRQQSMYVIPDVGAYCNVCHFKCSDASTEAKYIKQHNFRTGKKETQSALVINFHLSAFSTLSSGFLVPLTLHNMSLCALIQVHFASFCNPHFSYCSLHKFGQKKSVSLIYYTAVFL